MTDANLPTFDALSTSLHPMEQAVSSRNNPRPEAYHIKAGKVKGAVGGREPGTEKREPGAGSREPVLRSRRAGTQDK